MNNRSSHPSTSDLKNQGSNDAVSSEAIALGELELLAELSSWFLHSDDVDKTLHAVIARVVTCMEAEAGSVFLLQENGELLCEGCAGPVNLIGLRLPQGTGIVGKVVATQRPEIIRDVQSNPDFTPSVDRASGFRTRSLLCVPLLVHDECVGAMELLNKSDGALFGEHELYFASILAAAVALAIHNARMTGKLLVQERLRHELELAREIQVSLLADSESADLPIRGINVPAYEVSGDFYDFFRLEEGIIYFHIADVSGKGVNAAMLMIQASSLLRYLAQSVRDPGELLTRVNDELCKTFSRGMFITLISGFIDERNGIIRFSNAGHQAPLLCAMDGSFTEYSAQAPPLGISAEFTYSSTRLPLAAGSYYLFTDGITEAVNATGEPLDTDGLQKIIRQHIELPLEQRLRSIIADVHTFAIAQRDDITLLLIEAREAASTANTENTAEEGAAAFAYSYDSSNLLPQGKCICHLRLPAAVKYLKTLRETVRTILMQCDCEQRLSENLVLAVQEGCTNVIEHGYGGDTAAGEISLQVMDNRGVISFLIKDQAPLADLKKIRSRALDDIRPGGLGTHFIQQIMDECRWGHLQHDDGNYLYMSKRIRPAENSSDR